MTTAITMIVAVTTGGIITVRIPDVAVTGWGVIPARICAVAGATIPNAVAATIPNVGAMITAPNADRTATTTGMTEGGLGYAETEMGDTGGRNDMVHSALSEVRQVVDQPPRTWKPYMDSSDWWGIVEMELGEVRRAIKDHNASEERKRAAEKELSHLCAAVLSVKIHVMEEEVEQEKR